MALERAASEWVRVAGILTLRQAQGTEPQTGTRTQPQTGTRTEPKLAELVEAPRPDSLADVFADLLDHPDRSIGERAWRFHQGLAAVFADQLATAAAAAGATTVGLTGGVMVNRIFTTALIANLEAHALTVLTHRTVPPTDGGLSLGQVWAGRLLDA
jgi:hydrogenase maturation factor HypF (carbamoyltransferase family)